MGVLWWGRRAWPGFRVERLGIRICELGSTVKGSWVGPMVGIRGGGAVLVSEVPL